MISDTCSLFQYLVCRSKYSLLRNNLFKIALLGSANESVHEECSRTAPYNVILGDSTTQWRSGAVVQWLKGRASDSRLRGRGFESCAAVLKPWANVSLYIAPVHSAV